MHAKSLQTLCDPMDCSSPGPSVHGILQARMLEWVAIPFPGDLPDPGTKPGSPALQADFLCLSHQGSPMKYYSAIKRNAFESVLMRWMNLEPIIQREVSQNKKDKHLY